jgi:hypothetical protein
VARFCIAGIFGNRSDPDAALKTMIGLVAKGAGHACISVWNARSGVERRCQLRASRLPFSISRFSK